MLWGCALLFNAAIKIYDNNKTIKENMSQQFLTQFQVLKSASMNHEKHEWKSVEGLIKNIEKLTGADCWDANEFSKGVILYGAGSIGAGAFEYFSQKQIKVLGFVDDTPGRTGARYCGVEILTLDAAMKIDCPIIISMKLWLEPAARMASVGRAFEAFAHHVIART